MYCGKLTAPCEPSTDIVCGVENLLHRVNRRQTLCVVWKTYCTVWTVNRHCVWCGKLTELCEPSTDILCGVENLLNCVWCGKLTEPCVVWKTHWTVCGVDNLLNRVWCGKLIAPCEPSTHIVCGVESLLNCVLCGKLSIIVWIVKNFQLSCVPIFEIVCTVENLLHHVSWYWHHCVLWKTYCGKLTVENLRLSSFFIYRGKLTDIIVFHVSWKTYYPRVYHQYTCLINPTRT